MSSIKSFALLLLLNTFTALYGAPQTPACPPGTTANPTDASVCYLFVNNATWFSDAEYDCTSRGGHLTTVADGFANNFLARKLSTS